MDRRHFLATGLLGCLAAPATSFAQIQVPSQTIKVDGPLPLEAGFVHHALFWLKDKDNRDHYNNMLRFLKKFRDVKSVRFLHVGTPSISDIDFEAQATDATYTFSYLALFDSKKDKEDYLKHPLHTQFVKEFKDVVLKVRVYDSLYIAD